MFEKLSGIQGHYAGRFLDCCQRASKRQKATPFRHAEQRSGVPARNAKPRPRVPTRDAERGPALVQTRDAARGPALVPARDSERGSALVPTRDTAGRPAHRDQVTESACAHSHYLVRKYCVLQHLWQYQVLVVPVAAVPVVVVPVIMKSAYLRKCSPALDPEAAPGRAPRRPAGITQISTLNSNLNPNPKVSLHFCQKYVLK